jgi:hypothetical protein
MSDPACGALSRALDVNEDGVCSLLSFPGKERDPGDPIDWAW